MIGSGAGGGPLAARLAEAKPALFSLMFDPRLLARHEALREADDKTLMVFQSAIEADPRFPVALKANVALALWARSHVLLARRGAHERGLAAPKPR